MHGKGKGNIPRGALAVVSEPGKRELEPQRRLHKICKGAVTTRRSDAANVHLVEAACAFLAERRATTPFSKRELDKGALAKTLQKALGVGKDTARGLVTKLKQTKRGKELLAP